MIVPAKKLRVPVHPETPLPTGLVNIFALTYTAQWCKMHDSSLVGVKTESMANSNKEA